VDAPPARLVSQWDPRSFTSQKMMLELVRLGVTNGVMSVPTAREYLSLDDKIEGDRIEASAAAPQRYTPVFEAKQGMVNGANRAPGGRPSERPHPTGNEEND
jgi:hypothetical protein